MSEKKAKKGTVKKIEKKAAKKTAGRKKYSRRVKKASKKEIGERVDFAIEKLITGELYIEDQLIHKFKITKAAAIYAIQKARDLLKIHKNIQLEEILHSQISRYEELHKGFTDIDRKDLAIKTMEQKEKLLGIGKQTSLIQNKLREIKGVNEDLFLDEGKVSKKQKEFIFEKLGKCLV